MNTAISPVVTMHATNSFRWYVPKSHVIGGMTYLPEGRVLQQAWLCSDGSLVWKPVETFIEGQP